MLGEGPISSSKPSPKNGKFAVFVHNSLTGR